MPPRPEDEQRAFSRVALGATVSLDLPDGTTAIGRATDLSMAGIAVQSTSGPEVGVEGRVAIVFGAGPEPVVIRGSARVVRSLEDGFAVEIQELELDGYHHLQMLVLYHADAPSQVEAELDAHVGIKPR